MNSHFTRRTFLKGIGAVVALPMLESFAANTPAPIRMAHLYMANGVHPDQWTPVGTGRDFQLSPTLAPLAGVKDDILVLSELWNAASNTGDGHYVKTSGYLTSTYRDAIAFCLLIVILLFRPSGLFGAKQ